MDSCSGPRVRAVRCCRPRGAGERDWPRARRGRKRPPPTGSRLACHARKLRASDMRWLTKVPACSRNRPGSTAGGGERRGRASARLAARAVPSRGGRAATCRAVALAAARGVCEPVRDIYKCYFTPCSCRRTTRLCVAAAPPAGVVALVCSPPCFAGTAFFCVEQRWAISCQGPWGERALVKEPSWQPLGLWGCGSGGLLAKALAGPRNLRVSLVSSGASAPSDSVRTRKRAVTVAQTRGSRAHSVLEVYYHTVLAAARG